MRFVEITRLKEGDIVAKNLYDSQYRLLIASGKALTLNFITKIDELGIAGVFIEDSRSEGIELVDIIPQSLRIDVVKSLQTFDVDGVYRNARSIVDTLVTDAPIGGEFLNMKTYDSYTYEHSLSVGVYSVMLGIASKYRMLELVNLAMAALLHDIGKLQIDKQILEKPGKLTPEEYAVVKTHAEIGYQQLKENQNISATIKMGIYEHHENEDGSGYPRGIKGPEIYKFAKIIHIADVYDALISRRPYKKPMPAAEAIQFILANRGTMFDREYADTFVHITPAYPKGTIVRLSTGVEAIVVANHAGHCFRPVVRLDSGVELDLGSDAYKEIAIVDSVE